MTPRIDWMLLFGFAALALLISEVRACAPGFEPFFNGKCFQVIENTKSFTYEKAKKKCTDQGGLPAIIRNKKENDDLVTASQEFAKKHGIHTDNDMWIGLTCDAANDRFVWEDGTIANYTNVFDNSRCSKQYNGYHFYMDHKTGQWDSEFLFDPYQILCLHPHLTNDPCDWDMDLASGSAGETCVSIKSDATSWTEAEKHCTNMSAHLTSIHDETVNSFLRRSAIAQQLTTEIHIGASATNNGPIAWKDGTPMDYSNFYPGFPDVDEYGKCVALGVMSPFNGKWINVDCDEKRAYACSRPAFNFSTSVASECPSAQPFRAGQPIYSPGFPSRGSALLCDDYVLSAPKGKRIELTVVMFESNLCCDTLTLFDGLMATEPMQILRGSYTAGTKFTSTQHSMRMTWNATDAVNVRGFHLEMREV